MKMEERRKQIVELVNREGNVSFGRLKTEFDPVSEMTLRRDLEALDKAGSIIRVHGGVKSVEVVIGTDDLLLKRSVRNMEAKEIIAQKAVGLLRVNTAIFLDSGSTATMLAQRIPDNHYMIFTSGISCVQEMLRLNEVQIHMVGGKLNRASQKRMLFQESGVSGKCEFPDGLPGRDGLQFRAWLHLRHGGRMRAEAHGHPQHGHGGSDDGQQ